MEVRTYQMERGKCWLTPDGQFYYGDCLDKKSHVEIPPPPSDDHTVFDLENKVWLMSYMKEEDGKWVEDATLKAEYDARIKAEAEGPIYAALAAIDAEGARPAREFLAALALEESAITSAKDIDELKAALLRTIVVIPAKVIDLETQAEAERAKLSAASE